MSKKEESKKNALLKNYYSVSEKQDKLKESFTKEDI